MESKTAIKICRCQHEYQDAKYGKYKRVHNWAVNVDSKRGGWRCTVCNDVKSKGAGNELRIG